MECALHEVYQLAFSQGMYIHVYDIYNCIISFSDYHYVYYSAQSTLLFDYTSCMYEYTYLHVHVTHAGSSGGGGGGGRRLKANRAGRARAAAIQPAWFNYFVFFSELEEWEWLARRLAALEHVQQLRT